MACIAKRLLEGHHLMDGGQLYCIDLSHVRIHMRIVCTRHACCCTMCIAFCARSSQGIAKKKTLGRRTCFTKKSKDLLSAVNFIMQVTHAGASKALISLHLSMAGTLYLPSWVWSGPVPMILTDPTQILITTPVLLGVMRYQTAL